MENAQYQRLRSLLNAHLKSDKRLAKSAEKILSGSADFKDTSEIAEIISQHLGRILSENVIELGGDREAVCKQLIHDNYDDINDILSSVQTSLDGRTGVKIRPQKAKFPTERVQTLAHSLLDTTVSDATIKRRALSAATISMSFHDDYIKANAQFRHDAGLRCVIERFTTGDSCEWCSRIAGKYEYSQQPDGLFGRHDNCNCVIIYDGQPMRGQLLANGKRNRKWVNDPDAPKAFKPTIFSREKANELQERILGKYRLSGQNSAKAVDNSGESGIIKNIRLEDITAAASTSNIAPEITDAIYKALDDSGDRFLFDDVVVINTDSSIAMQTDPVKKGTFFDIRLNLNESFLGGKTMEKLNEEIDRSEATVANSVGELVIHEIYHAKLINNLNQAQLEALYDELSEIHIGGISKVAWQDGSECIAEIGVLFERGETENLPQKAKDLFNKYIGGIA